MYRIFWRVIFALAIGLNLNLVAFGETAPDPVTVNALARTTLYDFPLNSNPGWTAEGQWEFGSPTGGGGSLSGFPDPVGGVFGANVYGVNLAGDYATTTGTWTLTTGLLDFTGAVEVHLHFYRWLNIGTAPASRAFIEVSNNGTAWTRVWENLDGEGVADDAWQTAEYDISSVADGNSAVRVRWGYTIEPAALIASGWNIDDVSFTGLSSDRLVISPTDLSLTTNRATPFASGTFIVSNIGTGSINWSASTPAAWMSLSPASGSLPSGSAANVTVAPNAQTLLLAPGIYNDTVVFTDTTTGRVQARPVILTVYNVPGTIKVTDSCAPVDDLQLPFGNVPVNTQSATQTVTVKNASLRNPLVIANIIGTYVEDFNDGLAQDWVETEDPYWNVVAGEYVASNPNAGHQLQSTLVAPGLTWTDLRASVKIRKPAGETSATRLAFRCSDDFSYPAATGSALYVAITGSTGYYVMRQEGSSYTWLTGTWLYTSNLHSDGTVNEVTVNVVGTQIDVYFNGVLTWSGNDTVLTGPGRISLFTYCGSGSSSPAYFDDVTAGPSSAPAPPPPASSASLAAGTGVGVSANPDVAPAFHGVAPAAQSVASTGSQATRLAPLPPSGSATSTGNFLLYDMPTTFPLTLAPGQSITIRVVYAPVALVQDTGFLHIVSDDPANGMLSVILSGTPTEDYISITPTDTFEASGHPGGPFAPATREYSLTNPTSQPIAWSADGYAPWLALSTVTGTLAPGASTNITVGFSAAATTLTEAVATTDIHFHDLLTGNTITRSVALTVFTTPHISVEPASLSASAAITDTATRTLTVHNLPDADGKLRFQTSVQETARTLAPPPALGLPPAGMDFTRIPAGAEFAANQVLVRFAGSATGAARVAALDSVLAGCRIAREYSLVPGLCLVTLPAQTSVQDGLIALNGQPGIVYATPNYREKALTASLPFQTVPNDPQFGDLWGLHNTGQFGGSAGVDIDATNAWTLRKTAPNVIVAVIDTGIDYTHPDLAANIWTNTAEIPGNGIDDDGNGVIDDVHGANFIAGTGDPMDDNSHGTHCAGTIGAIGNNNLGVVGVCWNVQIMALKFLDSDGYGNDADAIECIEYATSMGAQVLSNSWGGAPYNQAMRDAIEASGRIFVVAAGNDYGNDNDANPVYPASYDCSNIISVLSINPTSAISDFSNYGATSVDIAAPGYNILSTLPGGDYGYKSGTSMATPHVAGACALLLQGNPFLSPTGVRQVLIDTAMTGLPSGCCVANGWLYLSQALLAGQPGWLTIAPDAASNIAPGTSQDLVVAFNATNLDPGTYQADIHVLSDDPTTPEIIVPATFTVTADDLTITPKDPVASAGLQGGPFEPHEMTYLMRNQGSTAHGVIALPSEPWLSLSPVTAIIPAGGSLTFTATINDMANLLSAGTAQNTIGFQNLESGITQPRQVNVTVAPRSSTGGFCGVDMNTDPGWTLQGSWAWGVPLGGGNAEYPDPTAGYTGAYVLGYNLAGDYVNNMGTTEWATTTPFDFSTHTGVKLTFYRWLGVERSQYDHAYIEVSNNGGTTWNSVWANDYNTSVRDTSWVYCEYDISTWADHQSAVQVRWGIGPTDSSVHYGGWNIDDIVFCDSSGPIRVGSVLFPAESLQSSGFTGGPFSPLSQTYRLVNGLNLSAALYVTHSEPWLNVGAVTASLAANGGAIDIPIAINPTVAATLAPGIYTDHVVFHQIAPTSETSHTRDIQLTVRAIPGEIDVTDSIAPTNDLAMPFGIMMNGQARVETVSIHNTDPTHSLTVSNIRLGGIEDNFDDGNADGWLATPSDAWSVVGGEYQSDSSQAGWGKSVFSSAGTVPRDCSVHVQIRKPAGDYYTSAVAFRTTPDFDLGDTPTGSGYAVGITNDGGYWVGEVMGGSFYWLTGGWSSSSNLYTDGTPNEILVSLVGDSIYLYFNGALQDTFWDSDIADAGMVSLHQYSPGASRQPAWFDNVVIDSPVAIQYSTPPLAAAPKSAAAKKAAKAPLADAASLAQAPAGLAAAAAAAPQRAAAKAPASLPSTGDLPISFFRLAALPTSFPLVLAPGASVDFSVVFASEFIPGDWFRYIHIDSDDLDEPETLVHLTGTTVDDYLSIDNSWADFYGMQGGPFVPSEVVGNLTNLSQDVPMTWHLENDASWVSLSPVSGTLAPGATVQITYTLTEAAATFPLGEYETYPVLYNETTGSAIPLYVELDVIPSAEATVAPSAYTVTLLAGQTATRTLTVANSARADYDLALQIYTCETSRVLVNASAAALAPVPAGVDFNRVAPGAVYDPNKILVRFAPEMAGAERAAALATRRGRVERNFQLVSGLCLVQLADGQSVEDALALYNATPGVLYAQPNYRVKASSTLPSFPSTIGTYPNDPYFDYLWGLHNYGSIGTADADIDAPEAWNWAHDASNVVVAVIDTGIDYTHPDLAANMWVNSGEIPGNGIDDDGDGIVDDVYGADFVNRDGDPMDDHGHGTHCAGTIGAVGNNGIGVAGVCWNVQIMALKFLDASGWGSDADAISAIEYAALKGVNVINASWGGADYNQALKDAIDTVGNAGIVFVAAAGNDSLDIDTTPEYPAAYSSPNIISVLATDPNDTPAYFTNYGPTSVDLAAPGVYILSTYPGGGYAEMDGTSMAAPHVSGACALIKAVNPALTVAQIKQCILSTTDQVLPPGGCVSNGRLNLNGAIGAAGAQWLSTSPSMLVGIPAGQTATAQVIFDARQLLPGTYYGEIWVLTNDVVNAYSLVPATLIVQAPSIAVTPAADQVIDGSVGGSFTPSDLPYEIHNVSTAPVSYTVTADAGWVSITSALSAASETPWASAAGALTGTIPAGGTATFHVGLSSLAQYLEAGTYTCSIHVTDGSTGADFLRRVILNVAPAPPEGFIVFPMDTDPGWTAEGQWQFGVPAGGGTHNLDPVAGRTGTNVYGYNLAGDYADSMTTQTLKTQALDCSHYENVQLLFWRWLGVEYADCDRARVEVSNDNATWTEVWANGAASIADTTWTQVSYDISAVADGHATVYIRWTMGSTDESVTYPGWNIDDVALQGDSTRPRAGVDAVSLPFGQQMVGAGPSEVKTVTIHNYGKENLNVSSIALSGAQSANFHIVSGATCPALATGDTHAIDLVYEPLTVGSQTANLVIATNDPAHGTITVGLSGLAPTGAPAGVTASKGTYIPRVLVTWQAVAGASYYRVARADSLTGSKTELGTWQTALSFNDTTAVAGQTSYYFVRAASSATGADAGAYSDPDTGWLATNPVLANYGIFYKNCAVTVVSNDLVQVTSDSPKASVAIKRLKKTPDDTSPVEGKVAYLIQVPFLTDLQTSGTIGKFYTDLSIVNLTASGGFGGISTKNAHIENIVAHGIGSINMTVYADATTSAPAYARTSVLQIGDHDFPMSLSLNGVILEDLVTHQPIKSMKIASKAFKSKATGTAGVSLAGVGRATPDAAAGYPSGDYELRANGIASLSVTGGPILPDRVVSSDDIGKFTGKSASLNKAAYPSSIGTLTSPTQCVLIAPNFGTVAATAGVHAKIVAGANTAEQPDYSGNVGTIATQKDVGTLSGEVHVSPDCNIKFVPDQGAMQVITGP